jgi:membrane protein CcdC involved in cytochrome C biogenesis
MEFIITIIIAMDIIYTDIIIIAIRAQPSPIDLDEVILIPTMRTAIAAGASAIAILADKGPKVWDVSAIGFIGFLFSAILGGYLVIKYIRD